MDRQKLHTEAMEHGTVHGIVHPERRGPREGEAGIGVDRQRERRPGVPKAAEPSDDEAVAGRPITSQQEQRGDRLHRVGLDEPTVVFGTAQPHRGLSGTLRTAAYRIPEHHARHWMLLLLADRVNTAEDRLTGGGLRSPEAPSFGRIGRGVRDHPLLSAGAVAAGIWLARRVRAY